MKLSKALRNCRVKVGDFVEVCVGESCSTGYVKGLRSVGSMVYVLVDGVGEYTLSQVCTVPTPEELEERRAEQWKNHLLKLDRKYGNEPIRANGSRRQFDEILGARYNSRK